MQIYDPAFVAEHMVAGNAPGHACEYETSTMLHLFPDRECDNLYQLPCVQTAQLGRLGWHTASAFFFLFLSAETMWQ